MHGRTYAEELDIPLARNKPQPLFALFCATILFSTRINADIAISAARALRKAGWTTPQKMARSTWRERTDVLNHSGYARYDESTSEAFGEDCQMLLERYEGDLRQLRDAAKRNPQEERKLLMEFKRIGDVGANIFLREAQVAWPELLPFADDRALDSARELGLPEDTRGLAKLVSKRNFARLVAGLVRVSLAADFDEVKARADNHKFKEDKKMPKAWSKKDEDQYEHIKESAKESGKSTDRAEEIAARTVNKQRRKEGRTPNKSTQGTGNPNNSYEERTKKELYNLAKEKDIEGRSKMDKSELVKALREK
jgi:hypothetical protein